MARLIAKGYKVAICEQMEDPSKAKGLVKRDIIRVVTPGTVIESSMLQDDKNNYIASIFSERECGGHLFCRCFHRYGPHHRAETREDRACRDRGALPLPSQRGADESRNAGLPC